MGFKSDFGTYIKTSGLPTGGQIVISESFTPLSLVLYPDGLSSITANIGDMLVSFDFHDEVLKVFLYIFQKYNLIDKQSLSDKIFLQTTSPISVSLSSASGQLQINGLVLSCEIGETESSATTAEVFTPLIITQAKIVEQPIGVLISPIAMQTSTKYIEIKENELNAGAQLMTLTMRMLENALKKNNIEYRYDAIKNSLVVPVQDMYDAARIHSILWNVSATFFDGNTSIRIPVPPAKKTSRPRNTVTNLETGKSTSLRKHMIQTKEDIERTHLTIPQIIKLKLLGRSAVLKYIEQGELVGTSYRGITYIDRMSLMNFLKKKLKK